MTENKINLGMTITNTSAEAKGEPKLFITTDTSMNQLTFSIANPSSTPITLTEGQTVFTVTPPTGLFTEAELKSVKAAGGDWQIHLNSGRFTNWTLKPLNPLPVSKGSPVSIQFTHLAISNQSEKGKGLFWTVAWQGIAEVNADTVQRKVFVYKPGKQNLNMSVQLGKGTQIAPQKKSHPYIPVYKIPGFPQFDGEVFITAEGTTPIYTRHTLYLTNNGNAVQFTEQSQFVLNFIICQDDRTDINALSRAANFKNMVVTQIINDPLKKWKTVQQQGEGTQMTWLLQPGSHIVLGHGSTVGFQLSGIYTVLKPYPTPVFVSYAHIPGTTPGMFTLLLEKRTAPAAVPVLTVDQQSVLAVSAGLQAPTVPNPLNVGLMQQVTLGWSTVGVTVASFDPQRGSSEPVHLVGSKQWIPYPTAEASGSASLSTTPLVSLGNRWNFNLKPAVIGLFEGNGKNPLTMPPGSLKITWQSQYASAVTLKNQGGRVLVHYQYNKNPTEVDKGSYQISQQMAGETFTLVLDGYRGPQSKTLQVTMAKVAIQSVLANGKSPLQLNKPAMVNITWQTSNASDVTLKSKNFGILYANYNRISNPGEVDHGSQQVPVMSDETLTLTAGGHPAPIEESVKLTCKPPVLFSYLPKEGVNGSVLIDYDFTLVNYDEIKLSVVVLLNGIPVCKNDHVIKNSAPKKGADKYKIPDNMQLSKGTKIQTKNTFSFTSSGEVFIQFLVLFSFVIGEKSQVFEITSLASPTETQPQNG